MSSSGISGAVRVFFAERFPLQKLSFKEFVEKKRVPVHGMSWGYYTGGLILFFFLIQVVTGLLLIYYYQPTVSDAFASVQFINNHVMGGWLIRNMHAWSSSLMIFFAIVHLLVTFAMKAFEKPRELSWIAGMLLIIITFAFGFTGYLLPWNQIAVNATKVGLQAMEESGHYLPAALAQLPGVLRESFQGGSSVGQVTLSRFYALHVVALPFAALLLIGFHLLMVQLHGVSQGVDKPSGEYQPFIPIFFSKEMGLWLVSFLALFVLTVCIPFDSFQPFPMLAPYDPFGATPEGIKPEWYFFFIYYPLEILPFWVVMVATATVTLVLFLTPWIFRRTSRKILLSIAVLAAIFLLVMTVFGEKIYELFRV